MKKEEFIKFIEVSLAVGDKSQMKLLREAKIIRFYEFVNKALAKFTSMSLVIKEEQKKSLRDFFSCVAIMVVFEEANFINKKSREEWMSMLKDTNSYKEIQCIREYQDVR